MVVGEGIYVVFVFDLGWLILVFIMLVILFGMGYIFFFICVLFDNLYLSFIVMFVVL